MYSAGSQSPGTRHLTNKRTFLAWIRTALALPRLVHAKAQSKQGALDVAEAFFNLHALPVDGHLLARSIY
ncbi:DUF202 domain-containing protein [Modicisalibacter radicis]